jgi:competence protein ComEC
MSLFSGIFVATLHPITLSVITWLSFIGFVAILIWYRSTLILEVRGLFLFGLFLVVFSLGLLRVEIANWAFDNSLLELEVDKEVTIIGQVTQVPEVRERATYLYVETEEDLVLVLVDRYEKVAYGDVVEVTGTLTKPENFETDLGRTFNYRGYLKAKGIEYKISFAQVKTLSQGNGNKLISYLFVFKSAFMSRLEASISEPAAGLGEGLLLGVKQALGEDLESAFRKTGIIHIVVLSGYNIMLVVIFIMYVLGFFLRKKLRVFAGILSIAAFAILVGLSATVLRASIMAALLLIVQATKRTYLVLRGLMLAGLIMILINPFLLVYDVGFQLSFLATLGLILISPHLENLFVKVPSLFGTRSFLVATISTQIAVLPILLYQIGEFSVVAVLVNILVLPMVPIAMLLTFITGLTAFIFPSLALVFSYPAYLSLEYIISIAWWFSKLPFAAYIVPAFSFYFVPLAYAGLGYFLWRLRKPESNQEDNLTEKSLESKRGVTLSINPPQTIQILFK